jgi:multimeric flavodoxin WrbA
MEKGNTALLLRPFLDGMREEGCDVELVYTCKLRVKPCLGDRACWTRTLGKCVQNDDVKELLPRIQEADFMVFATPVYVDGMPGTLKNLIDRFIPLIEPYFVMREGHCRHPPREPRRQPKLVLIANCGFWEMDNFDPLVVHVKAVCKNMCWDFAGALLRPHGEALGYMVKNGLEVQDVLTAAKNAGRELARTGKISKVNMKTVSRELISLKNYVEITNKGFKGALDKVSRSQQDA